MRGGTLLILGHGQRSRSIPPHPTLRGDATQLGVVLDISTNFLSNSLISNGVKCFIYIYFVKFS